MYCFLLYALFSVYILFSTFVILYATLQQIFNIISNFYIICALSLIFVISNPNLFIRFLMLFDCLVLPCVQSERRSYQINKTTHLRKTEEKEG